MVFLELLLLAVALIGHTALWVAAINRVNAIALPRTIVKGISSLAHLALVVVPGSFALWFLLAGVLLPRWSDTQLSVWAAWFYLVPCYITAIGPVPSWLLRRLSTHNSPAELSDQVQDVNLVAGQGHRWVSGLKSQMLIRLRGNQLFHLYIHDKELALERLPIWLDGLTIAHISDLHIGEHIDLDFQRQVIELTTQMQADMIVISGDIVDDETYLPQLADLLRPLTARYGAYFILGNHDLRIKDVRALRKLLTSAGMIDLGGRWQWIDLPGGRFVIAGNELPWITPAADMSNCPTHLDQEHLFRLLVAHTPDQIDWAREHDFDLMLAGHMHGGQIRFPIIGPIVGPSRHGTKYASGTFYEPPTVMHVSRGVCGLTPVRLNCPPEITKLTLRRRSLQAP